MGHSVSVIFAAMLGSILLAGCGEKTQPTPTEGVDAPSTAASATEGAAEGRDTREARGSGGARTERGKRPVRGGALPQKGCAEKTVTPADQEWCDSSCARTGDDEEDGLCAITCSYGADETGNCVLTEKCSQCDEIPDPTTTSGSQPDGGRGI